MPSFRDNEAVSPVIGTILMVSIAVLLAASVFIAINVLRDEVDTEPKPQPGMSTDERTDSFQVVHGGPVPMDWSDVAVTGCTGVPSSGSVSGGQQITGCSGDVTMVHEPTNTLVYQHTFT